MHMRGILTAAMMIAAVIATERPSRACDNDRYPCKPATSAKRPSPAATKLSVAATAILPPERTSPVLLPAIGIFMHQIGVIGAVDPNDDDTADPNSFAGRVSAMGLAADAMTREEIADTASADITASDTTGEIAADAVHVVFADDLNEIDLAAPPVSLAVFQPEAHSVIGRTAAALFSGFLDVRDDVADPAMFERALMALAGAFAAIAAMRIFAL